MSITSMFPSARFKQMLDLARQDRQDAADAQSAEVKELAAHIRQTCRADAGESLFFARQLEHIRPGVLEIQYPELKGSSLVPTDTSIDPGAASLTVQFFDHVGQAKVVADMDTEIPRADVSASEGNQIIRSIVTSYGYTIQEARAAMFARTPLLPRRAMAARDAIERKLDDVIFVGETVMGLKGLLNQTGTVTYTILNGGAGDTNWETKTPDEIITDMTAAVNKIVVDSLGMEEPDTMILPLSSYTYIASKRMGDGDSTTILDHFKRCCPMIKTITSTYKLESNTGWTGKRMVIYRKDPNKLAFLLPQPFEQFAPQAKNFALITNCHARTGGVALYYPKSVCYADDI